VSIKVHIFHDKAQKENACMMSGESIYPTKISQHTRLISMPNWWWQLFADAVDLVINNCLVIVYFRNVWRISPSTYFLKHDNSDEVGQLSVQPISFWLCIWYLQ